MGFLKDILPFVGFGAGGGAAINAAGKVPDAYDPTDTIKGIAESNLSDYDRISREGLLSPEELGQVNAEWDKSFAFKRRSYAEAWKRKGSRGVGPRSGAVDTLITNRVLGPSFAAQSESRANNLKENLRSRILGLKGKSEVARTFALLTPEEQETMLDKILGFGQAGLDIAALIPGPHQPIAAAGSAGARALRGSGGSSRSRSFETDELIDY